ncbi:SufE family protein [Candidatus Sumerlaeota bacterium]|nr:SufE family protein [Candidatus Sumerlaeota bacterium]
MAALTDLTPEKLTETFEFLGEWEERYGYIIDLGRMLPPMDEALKTEANRVYGCQSMVWMAANQEPGDPPRLLFTADSDALIVKGLIAILMVCYNARTPQEIIGFEFDKFIERLALSQHLSPTRSNGLYEMVKRIRQLAVEAASKGGEAQ